MVRLAIVLALICLAVLPSGIAYGIEIELWPESYFQLQQYRDVDQLKIDKTRFTQYLTLNLYESSEKPQHFFYSSFRIDLDLGRDNSPDYSPNPLDYHSLALLYAYWEWRRIGDMVDLSLGRQILSDELGIAAIDGAKVTIVRDWFVGIELVAGFEVKGALNESSESFMLPNSDTHEPDGVIGDEHQTALFSVATYLNGIDDTRLRIQYRHRYSGETDSMNLGFAFKQKIFDVWEIYTYDDFNILTERFTRLDFGTGIDFEFVAFHLDHHASWVSFDGDSIFNYFDVFNEKSISATAYVNPDGKTHFNLSYTRQHQGNGSWFFDDWGHDGNASHLADFAFSRLIGETSDVRMSYSYSRGWGGDNQRFSVGAGAMLWQRRIRLDGSFAGTYFNRLLYTDILEGNRNAGFSWGFAALSEFVVNRGVSITVQGEFNSNQYMKKQFALFTGLDIHMDL